MVTQGRTGIFICSVGNSIQECTVLQPWRPDKFLPHESLKCLTPVLSKWLRDLPTTNESPRTACRHKELKYRHPLRHLPPPSMCSPYSWGRNKREAHWSRTKTLICPASWRQVAHVFMIGRAGPCCCCINYTYCYVWAIVLNAGFHVIFAKTFFTSSNSFIFLCILRSLNFTYEKTWRVVERRWLKRSPLQLVVDEECRGFFRVFPFALSLKSFIHLVSALRIGKLTCW
jgi:hypothetical protein